MDGRILAVSGGDVCVCVGLGVGIDVWRRKYGATKFSINGTVE